jgi:rhodanese-related sulfurtransferase
LQKIDPNKSIILDVRTDMEHAEKHIAQEHIHIPLDQLDAQSLIAQKGLSPETCIYLLCRSGARATQAAQKFFSAGFYNVKVVKGGIVSCEECGQNLNGYGAPKASCSPCADRCKPLPLERQVRIAAGLFIAIGSLLALFVHSVFAVIPLFVGCGLIFAGITDRCGLALVLTKAPWNKV